MSKMIPTRHLCAAVLSLGLVSLGLAGCRRPDPRRTSLGEEAATAPERIVCGSPAVTEIVFALGCGDRVVGVSEYTRYPPEATRKATVGGLLNPNRERLLALAPDIILTQGEHETLSDFAVKNGIRFRAVKLDTLGDAYAAIDAIGVLLGVEENAVRLTADIRSALGTVRDRASSLKRRRVFVVFGRSPGSLTGLSTVGPGTFLDELIALAGGTNIFADAMGQWPQISKESLVVRRPEVILEMDPGKRSAEALQQMRRDWQRIEGIPAVANEDIQFLTNDYLLILGPRVGRTARRLAEAIHPGVFDE